MITATSELFGLKANFEFSLLCKLCPGDFNIGLSVL